MKKCERKLTNNNSLINEIPHWLNAFLSQSLSPLCVNVIIECYMRKIQCEIKGIFNCKFHSNSAIFSLSFTISNDLSYTIIHYLIEYYTYMAFVCSNMKVYLAFYDSSKVMLWIDGIISMYD